MPLIPRWEDKDPQDIAAYAVDWSERLGEDTISTSTFSVVSGNVSIASQDKTDTLARCALSGGTLNETCEILNHIVTAGGKEYDQTVSLRIRKR